MQSSFLTYPRLKRGEPLIALDSQQLRRDMKYFCVRGTPLRGEGGGGRGETVLSPRKAPLDTG